MTLDNGQLEGTTMAADTGTVLLPSLVMCVYTACKLTHCIIVFPSFLLHFSSTSHI